jgi:hypothetical protein
MPVANLMYGGGRKKKPKKQTKKVLKVKIQRDKQGRFIVVNKKKYRISDKVKDESLAKWVLKKIMTEKKEKKKDEEGGFVPNLQPYKDESLPEVVIQSELKKTQEELAKQIKERKELEKFLTQEEKQAMKEIKLRAGDKKLTLDDLKKVIKNRIVEPKKMADIDLLKEKYPKFKKEEEKKEIEKRVREKQEKLEDLIGVKRGSFSEKKNEEELDDILQKELENQEEKKGNGAKKSDEKKMCKDGLSNFQIDEMLKMIPEYKGCISSNELSKIKPLPRSRGGVIINTSPSTKKGEHWVSLFWDARKEGSNSIEYYDPLSDPILPSIQEGIKHLAERLNAHTYLKLKENKIKNQSDKSSNCGFFCVKFILDRMRGVPWVESSGFSNVKQGEGSIENMKADYGYIPSFGKKVVGAGILSTLKKIGKTGFTVAKNVIKNQPFITGRYPKSIQDLIDKYGNTPINEIGIYRDPINKAVSTVLNILSLGTFKKAQKKLGYSDMFHLYMVINPGKDNIRIERNEIPMGSIKAPSTDKDQQSMNVPDIPAGLTFGELMKNTADKVGYDKLNLYDVQNNNCQKFVIDVLQSNNLLNPALQSFIEQDSKSIFKAMPAYVKTVADLATNVAHKGRALTGQGKKRGRPRKITGGKSQMDTQLRFQVEPNYDFLDDFII